MPEGWQWDPSLFAGSARYYTQGRLPYPGGLADRFRSVADLGGRPRLLDVGCGPGTVALTLAGLFVEVIGIDPDHDMLEEAARRAHHLGLTNTAWIEARAEELAPSLGPVRYATFAQSFHWMDRPQVAARVFDLLEPGGAFVHVNTEVADSPAPPVLPHPLAPTAAVADLVATYLGVHRRAGRGELRHGTPGGEGAVLAAAGYEPVQVVLVEGRRILERSVDDVVADVFSRSSSAPHLFGADLARFETDLRRLLGAAADEGWFSAWQGDLSLDFYRRPREGAA
ncbi:MAG TPA: class I SAM-dependent methyltransferase [Acidimicrobiales bacterium]|nr:class I SAM-dependent methyltransferase [Acidimicrobiales bacterium]